MRKIVVSKDNTIRQSTGKPDGPSRIEIVTGWIWRAIPPLAEHVDSNADPACSECGFEQASHCEFIFPSFHIEDT